MHITENGSGSPNTVTIPYLKNWKCVYDQTAFRDEDGQAKNPS